jgi:hypothetical protein
MPKWIGHQEVARHREVASQPRHRRAVLTAIKLIHTVAWFSIESCMVYVLWADFTRRSDRRAAIAAGVVAAGVVAAGVVAG